MRIVTPETLKPETVLTQSPKKETPPVTGKAASGETKSKSLLPMDQVPTNLEEAKAIIEQKIKEFDGPPLLVGRCSEEFYQKLIENKFIDPRHLDYDLINGVLYIASGMPSRLHGRISRVLCNTVADAVFAQLGVRLSPEGNADSKIYGTHSKQPDDQLVGRYDDHRHIVFEVAYLNENLDKLRDELFDWSTSSEGFDVAVGVKIYTEGELKLKVTFVFLFQFLTMTGDSSTCREFDVCEVNKGTAQLELALSNVPDGQSRPSIVKADLNEVFEDFVIKARRAAASRPANPVGC